MSRDGATWDGSVQSLRDIRTQTYQVKDQQSSPRSNRVQRILRGAVLGPQGFIPYTEDLAELIEEQNSGPPHVCRKKSGNLVTPLTINDIPSVATRLQNLHRSHPPLVQIEKVPAESNKD